MRGRVAQHALVQLVRERREHDLEQVVAVLPQSWDLARLDRVPVTELAKRPLIAISPTIAPAVFAITEELERRSGVRFNSSFSSESLMTSLNAVASGLGFCLFAEYVGEVVPKGVVTVTCTA